MDGASRAAPADVGGAAPLNAMERIVGGLVVLSRYLLVVFYLGLVAALAVYAFVFARHIWSLALRHEEISVLAALATMLQLIDAALVASLTIMVVFSNYENFIGRAISRDAREVSWLGKLDPSSLKIKIATTIITIASIYMLKVFIDIEKHAQEQILWQLVICSFFIVAGLALVAIDRIAGGRAGKPGLGEAAGD